MPFGPVGRLEGGVKGVFGGFVGGNSLHFSMGGGILEVIESSLSLISSWTDFGSLFLGLIKCLSLTLYSKVECGTP